MHDRIAVPADKRLRQLVLSECHDTLCGHLGTFKTLHRVTNKFWWPHMGRTVKTYVNSCPSCQRSKPVTQLPAGLLKPLDVPTAPWEQITVDFIQLPVSTQGNDYVMTVCDRLTKVTQFTPCKSTITAEQLADLFVSTVYMHYGCPLIVFSDRDKLFTSRFYSAFAARLGTKLRLSTAFHPQTDGQTERAHRTLLEMMRSLVGTQHANWEWHLPIVQFAYNTSIHPTHGCTPYYLLYGYNPASPLDCLTTTKSGVPAVDTRLADLQHALEAARHCLTMARDKAMSWANERRRDQTFKVDDMVLLSTKHILLSPGLHHKFLPRYLGPFKVVRNIRDVSYELALPLEMHMHNVFHTSLLRPWVEPSGLGQFPVPRDFTLPPAIDVEDDQWLVDTLLAKRKVGKTNKWKYFVA
jgi:transposase InsO family protein